VDRLVLFPESGAILFEAYRRVVLKRFPYMAVYITSGDRIDVLALVCVDAIRSGSRPPSPVAPTCRRRWPPESTDLTT